MILKKSFSSSTRIRKTLLGPIRVLMRSSVISNELGEAVYRLLDGVCTSMSPNGAAERSSNPAAL